MKIPWWYKKAWNDDFGKGLILGALVGAPLFSVASLLIAGGPDTWWQAGAFGWGFFVIILLPAFYLSRNTK
jgi:hypothetical protein